MELVADPGATVRCRHCGKDWPATMQSCPDCLAELHTDPAVVVEAMSRILAAGGHLYRPDGVAAFAHGPACTLLRLSAQGGLAFVGDDGLVEATVAGAGSHALVPLTCHDRDGKVLFRMVAYEPAERAVVAVAGDGAPLGTYLAAGTSIEVRDETSAPVARLVARRGQYELVETGGSGLAQVGRAMVEIDGWIDDQWWLQPQPVASVCRFGLWARWRWSWGRRCCWGGPPRCGRPPATTIRTSPGRGRSAEGARVSVGRVHRPAALPGLGSIGRVVGRRIIGTAIAHGYDRGDLRRACHPRQ